jgi:phage terminase small subunit
MWRCEGMTNKRLLNPKQKAFVEEYLSNDYNATAAYTKAFGVRSSEAAHNLLKKPYVQDYLTELRQEIMSNNIAKAVEVLQFYTDTMRDDNIAIKDRIKCAELLGKYYNMFENTPKDDKITIRIT